MTSNTDSRYYYATVVSENGGVLICCRNPWYMFHCDSKGKLVDKFLWDGFYSVFDEELERREGQLAWRMPKREPCPWQHQLDVEVDLVLLCVLLAA
ncbi:hypothetical protein E2562_013182 [Oryza meyeriana var. granulata]|uniref:Uncharacterized protein n=1 Tax=Oryza meyeriana var. granulata TaxID=110450 RepID=A0A6G1DII7_9ORYZ|nr:hypothetical protein E2562_013182 [Oryza meyeriana var. granulata]